MILDTLKNFSLYSEILPGFSDVALFIAEHDLAGLAPGRHEIDGDRVYANVQDYTTHEFAPDRYEAHRAYADVQVVVSGAERVGLVPLTPCLPETVPFDEKKDIGFYRAEEKTVELPAGSFLVLFPHEAHEPGVHPSSSAPAAVRKIVFKVQL